MRSESRHFSLLIVAGLILAVHATLLPRADSQSLDSSEQTPSTTLHSSTSLVLVDVVVTNKGTPVQGLNQSQFHVLEDGKEQLINAFDEHKTPVAGSGESLTPLPPDTYTDRLEYPESTAANVLLLDALNTPVGDQMQARQQMLDYLKKLPPGTPLAVFTLGSRLRLVQGLSADRTALTAALRGLGTNSRPSPVLDKASDQALDSTIGDLSGLGASQQAVNAMQQFAADNTAMRTDQRVLLTLEAMQQLARYCSGIPTRKNLIWFSGSFPLSLDADASFDSPLDSVRNYSEELRETSHLLSAARVAVYPVDARSLLTLPMVDANYSASASPNPAGSGGGPTGQRRGTLASGTPGFAKDNLKFMKQTQSEHASMLQVAFDTGGWAFFETNGLQESIDRIMRHGSNYYTIAYQSSTRQMDGRLRRIEVRVDGGKYQLAYRTGYYADDPGKRFAFRSTEPSLLTTLAHEAPVSAELLFTVHAAPSNSELMGQASSDADSPGPARQSLPLGRKSYAMEFNLDPHSLDMKKLADGSLAAQVEFIVVAYTQDGRALTRVDKGFAFHLGTAQYSAALHSGIPRQILIDLPSGQIYLRVAVHDILSNRIGSMEFPIRVQGH
jgi:VWFA-related protein